MPNLIFDPWTAWATLFILAVAAFIMSWTILQNLLTIWISGWAMDILSLIAFFYLIIYARPEWPISWLILGFGMWLVGMIILTYFMIMLLFID
jgi:1,4-dihydroxy-2-naphthoate octaprenyltransferase